MFRLRYVSGVLVCGLILAMTGLAQAQPPVAKPQPPPPGTTGVPAPASSAPTAGTPRQQPAPARQVAPATPAPVQPPAPTLPQIPPPADSATDPPPTDAQLGGMRVYPGATFLGSYDAGLGQRFYLFGVQQTFAETVAFYKADLKEKGELVFELPPTHMFDVGKFREETMAFPPSVTVKDYTWGGAPGYANPKPGATPVAFPTVIQIVPPPAGAIR